MTRVAAASPFFVVCLALAVGGGPVGLASGLGLLLALAAVLGPRVEADVASQRLVSLVVAMLGPSLWNAVDEASPAGALPTFWVGVALAACLVGALRSTFVQPDGGARLSAVVAVVGFMACGEARSPATYGPLVVVFLVSLLWHLRAEDPARPALARVSGRSRFVGAGVVITGAVVALGLSLPLRPLSDWMQSRIDGAYEQMLAPRAAFADTMRLGRLRRMLSSSTVALRLRGPRVELLRGVVFDTYENGSWARTESAAVRRLPPRPDEPVAGSVVEVTRGSRESDRVFLPMEARTVVGTTSALEVDAFGVVRAETLTGARHYQFDVGERSTALETAPPSPRDLAVPEDVRPLLAPLVTSWTRGTHDAPGVLRALEAHLLSEFVYATDHEHLRHRDPVLDFLFLDRAGHCEYFASAFALLGRTAGIPTRVVAGYRVHERNPMLGHYVVRDRNAHAWVEAWVEGQGWSAFDPTPGSEDLLRQDSELDLLGTVVDSVAVVWERARGWLAERTVLELSVAAAAGTLLFVAQRRRRRGKSGEPAAEDGLGPPAKPAPHVLALLDALARRGFVRAPHETLESLAARLDDPTAAELLRRYVGHRYGGRPDDTLARDMDSYGHGQPDERR